LFEKLMAQHENKSIPSQSLLAPEIVTLPPQSAKILLEQLPFLNKFGFEVEEFGTNTFQVRSMPMLFAGGSPAMALKALVEDFEEDESPLQAEVEARLAARVCKRLAVKGGQALTSEEQRSLLNDLENCQSPRTCPHGRPTMIHLTLAGIAMAANWAFKGDLALFKDYGPLELADDLYVKGNIFADKELLKRLPVLPASCVESSRVLLQRRAHYERDGVFPAGVIDYVAGMLQAENDEFMNKKLTDLPAHDRLLEIRKIMHKDLHKN